MTALVEAGAIRAARPGDAAALAAMFDRCSPQSRYLRFHAPVTAIPEAYLRRCLGPDAHRAYVAESPAGVIALGSGGLVAPGVHEAGLLVEDAWQRQGLGRALFAEILAGARREGARRIRLWICHVQPSLIAYVRGHARVVASASAGCDVTLDLAVDGVDLTRRRRPAAGTAR